MTLRACRPDDLDKVLVCFNRAVRTTGARFYAPEQIAVWAPPEPDRDAWAQRLASDGVWVEERDGRIAGFMRVERDGYLDLLFVDPDYARRGIGRQLLQEAMTRAAAQGARHMEAHVSLAARALFEAAGFRLVAEEQVERGGVVLARLHMRRALTG